MRRNSEASQHSQSPLLSQAMAFCGEIACRVRLTVASLAWTDGSVTEKWMLSRRATGYQYKIFRKYSPAPENDKRLAFGR